MGLFDFNGDGHTDFGEGLFGLGMLGAAISAAEELSRGDSFDERESVLEDMEMQLDELNTQIPDDPDSAAYRKWEKRCEELEHKIDKLAEEIYG